MHKGQGENAPEGEGLSGTTFHAWIKRVVLIESINSPFFLKLLYLHTAEAAPEPFEGSITEAPAPEDGEGDEDCPDDDDNTGLLQAADLAIEAQSKSIKQRGRENGLEQVVREGHPADRGEGFLDYARISLQDKKYLEERGIGNGDKEAAPVIPLVSEEHGIFH